MKTALPYQFCVVIIQYTLKTIPVMFILTYKKHIQKKKGKNAATIDTDTELEAWKERARLAGEMG